MHVGDGEQARTQDTLMGEKYGPHVCGGTADEVVAVEARNQSRPHSSLAAQSQQCYEWQAVLVR